MSILENVNAAVEAMRKATKRIDELNAENLKLVARLARMRQALEDIEDRAQDKYDGPEDNTHGPYLSMAQEGLGIIP